MMNHQNAGGGEGREGMKMWDVKMKDEGKKKQHTK